MDRDEFTDQFDQFEVEPGPDSIPDSGEHPIFDSGNRVDTDTANDRFIKKFRKADAWLDGHFLLSSGRHSRTYLQCARVLMDPKRAEDLCRALADKVRARFDTIDCVIAPAMGGLMVGYELARALGVESMFVERVDGVFALRRGFAIEQGARVLVVEDVITTGLSAREAIDTIGKAGGNVIAGACLVDRSNGKADIGVPYESLISVEIETFPPDQIPEDLRDVKAVKPGSRHMEDGLS